jgi:transcription elongation factor Elf1
MEHFFNCPYCGERISMTVDMSVRRQIYIEDCEVCCRPIQIRYTVVGDDIAEFNVRTMNDTP